MSYQFFEVEGNLNIAFPLSIWLVYKHILNLLAPTENTLLSKRNKGIEKQTIHSSFMSDKKEIIS